MRRNVGAAVLAALVASVLVTAPAAGHQPSSSTDVSASVTTVPSDAAVSLKLVVYHPSLNGCSQVGSDGAFSFKTEGDPVGVHDLGGSVAVTVAGSESSGYSVAISGGVLADVILKSSRFNHHWYHFHPGVTEAAPLFAPEGKEVSYFWFCYDTEQPPPPPPDGEGGTIIIEKYAVPTGSQPFTFGGDLGSFQIVDSQRGTGNPGSQQTFSGLDPATYTIYEEVPDGWSLDGIRCVILDGSDSTHTVNLSSASVTIDLVEGETVYCDFQNRKPRTRTR